MRMKPLTLLLVLAGALAAADIHAQQPPTPSGSQTPYKPDFVIPKPDGPAANQEPPPEGATGPAGPGYVIGIGDNLAITVVGEAELTSKFRVDADGTITYPYLGRVPAAGIKLGDL